MTIVLERLWSSVRTIKLMSLSTIVMLILAGVASFFATHYVRDSQTANGSLFAISWFCAGTGVIASCALVGSAPSWSEFGTKKFLGALFGVFSGTFAVVFVLLGMIAAFVADSTSTAPTSHFDGPLFASIWVADLAGLAVGFFVQLALFVDDSWIATDIYAGSSTSPIGRRIGS